MATAFAVSVASEIRETLKSAGRSQCDLAAALGWSDAYLSRRLHGHVSFSLSDIEQIASALDVPRSDLLDVSLPQRSTTRRAG
jgi:transcriptional regulator with XRE-family HTH domain